MSDAAGTSVLVRPGCDRTPNPNAEDDEMSVGDSSLATTDLPAYRALQLSCRSEPLRSCPVPIPKRRQSVVQRRRLGASWPWVALEPHGSLSAFRLSSQHAPVPAILGCVGRAHRSGPTERCHPRHPQSTSRVHMNVHKHAVRVDGDEVHPVTVSQHARRRVAGFVGDHEGADGWARSGRSRLRPQRGSGT